MRIYIKKWRLFFGSSTLKGKMLKTISTAPSDHLPNNDTCIIIFKDIFITNENLEITGLYDAVDNSELIKLKL